VVSFTLRPLYPQGKSPWHPLDRRLGGPRAVLDAVVKREIPSPRRESNPRTSIVQPVAQSLYRLSYHGSSVYIKPSQNLFFDIVKLKKKKKYIYIYIYI
jgi:hypothetical protein